MILIIRDPASIITAGCEIMQCLERNILVLIKVVKKLSDTDYKISLVEPVGNIPPERVELPSLLDYRM